MVSPGRGSVPVGPAWLQIVPSRPYGDRLPGPSSFTARRVCVQLGTARRGLFRPYSSMLPVLLMQRMVLIDPLELRSDGGGVVLEGALTTSS
jgi:hypothetical protein